MDHDELIRKLSDDFRRGAPAETRVDSRRAMLRGAWLALPFALAAAPVAMLGFRPDLRSGELSPGLPIYLAGLAGLAWAMLDAAWISGIPGRSLPRRTWTASAVAGALIVVGLALLATQALAREGLADGLAAWGYRCSETEALLTVVPLLLLYAVFRRLAPGDPGRTGALALAGLGAASAAALGLHCVSDHPLHILVWHFLPVAAGIGPGALLGRKLLRW